MAKLAFASAYAGATNIPSIRLAEKLVKLAYPSSSAVYFTTAGAEFERVRLQDRTLLLEASRQAREGEDLLPRARLSRRHDGGDERHGHGRIPQDLRPAGAELSAGAGALPYRWPGNEDPGIGAADAFERAILEEGADTVAAIIAEPVMGAGGVIVPPATYFPRLREICDRHNILLIADEVITGFGRTGRWFALGHWGVEPDLVTFAKGVTSAYLPLGGVLISRKVHQVMLEAPADQKFMHAATYSGHPACCAVGLRNIEIIEHENLVERSADNGTPPACGLGNVARSPVVGDVRGLGMMCGVELVDEQAEQSTRDRPRRPCRA